MSYKFEVQSGKTVKFPVKGKYCDRDIEVTATGGGGITVSSENLHDVSTDLVNVYLYAGIETAYNGWNATDYIPTKADKYYFVYSPSTVQGSWSARYGADKVYRGTLPATCSCTSKTSPFLLKGHDGYVRFSGTKAAITPIEVYEVSGFVWEVNG